MSQNNVIQRAPRQPGFFARQFENQPTEAQRAFDAIFGVVFPVICFELDPIVFKSAGGIFGPAYAGDYQFLVYFISAVQITAMVVWYTLGSRLGSFSAVIGFVLILGGLVSVVIGVFLLPLSLIGLILVLGILGFTPFLTGFAYIRSGVRAMRSCPPKKVYAPMVVGAIASAVITLAVPLAVNTWVQSTVSRSVTTILHNPLPEADDAIDNLRRMPIRDSERRRFLSEYERQMNPDRRALIRRSYRAIFDQNIERDIRIYND